MKWSRVMNREGIKQLEESGCKNNHCYRTQLMRHGGCLIVLLLVLGGSVRIDTVHLDYRRALSQVGSNDNRDSH